MIYEKTDKGVDEIATRVHGLGRRLRNMLLMIDGVRSDKDLYESVALLGDVDVILHELEAEGFIRQQGSHSRPPNPRVNTDPLEVTRTHLTEFVHNLLGSEAKPFLAEIAACQDTSSLKECIDACTEMVENMVGHAEAETFRTMFAKALK
jgi:hypothetical protein